jgi:prenyltransferase beta subunit
MKKEDSTMTRLALVLACSLTCLASGYAQSPEARKATIAYVQKLQTKTGGFLSEEADLKSKPAKLPTLRATSAAVRALKYLGGDVPNPKGCAQFVAECFDKSSGGFADQPKGKPDVFTTAVGLMAVTELKMPDSYHALAAKYLADHAKSFDEIRIAVAGLERIKATSPANAAWVKEVKQIKIPSDVNDKGAARTAASVLVTRLRLGEKGETVEQLLGSSEQLLKLIKAGQRNDGGFGKADVATSDLESTYRVMRCFMMLKAKPAEVEQVRTYVAKCRNEDGGYGITPGQPSNVSATYFAAIVLHWLDDRK